MKKVPQAISIKILGLLTQGKSAPAPRFFARPEVALFVLESTVSMASSPHVSDIGRVHEADVVVIGAGPGGYSAAFHAADLGLQTVLVDLREKPGGACLHVGCIPSKALLHVSQILYQAEQASVLGVEFQKPRVDINRVREWKDDVIQKLTGGLGKIAKMRGVKFVQGRAVFQNSQQLKVNGEAPAEIRFKHAIIATGSRPTTFPPFDIESERILDSSSGLEIREAYERLLIVGGGYIGLELGTVYAALGSKVTIVELTEGLLRGVDRDLVRPLAKRLGESFEAIHLKTSVDRLNESSQGVEVQLKGNVNSSEVFDAVLVAVGRTANTDGLGLENTKVRLQDNFVAIDEQCRTSDPSIFAIGDVAGQPMLAHKAFREGKIAAQVMAGKAAALDNLAIPAVVFTDPEIAWCGLTETEARQEGREVSVAKFPWSASGRALTLGRTDGLTKIVFDPETQAVLGVGIAGPGAGELIAEGCLAIEMAAVAEDLAATIHPHPTLSETVMEATEVLFGHSSHVYRRRQ